jgi:hypothetical protein
MTIKTGEVFAAAVVGILLTFVLINASTPPSTTSTATAPAKIAAPEAAPATEPPATTTAKTAPATPPAQSAPPSKWWGLAKKSGASEFNTSAFTSCEEQTKVSPASMYEYLRDQGRFPKIEEKGDATIISHSQGSITNQLAFYRTEAACEKAARLNAQANADLNKYR